MDRQTELDDDDGSLTGLIKTISVNQDPFFSAPVETPECASDVPTSVSPGTAKTSPYDYVTSVVYPYCALSCGDVWATDCTNPNCYGVPLYRNNVNPGELGTTPNIRMMGQATGQRSTLAVNNNSYYVDTTVSADDQRKVVGARGNLNVFEAGKTYYLFLLFAKPTTVQTYQLYVGPTFNVNTDVSLVRVDISSSPLKFGAGSWPDSGWTRSYNATSGVLTVTMDMSLPEFQLEYDAARKEKCQPQSFCTPNSDESCGCALDSGDPLYDECGKVCMNWAGKDIDRPTDGCFGISVTLSSGFTTGPENGLPPAPKCFPHNKLWNIPFDPASQEVAGSCFYSTAPKGKFCSGESHPSVFREKSGN